MALTKVKASNITLSTPAANSNDTTIATTAYVTTAVANLIDNAPANLNTLNELAAAMADNDSFFSTVLPLAGGTMTGNIAHASDFTLDVGGDITLDADGADFKFQDGGSEFLRVSRDGNGNAVFQSIGQNKSVYFSGDDAGTGINALVLNMSEAGKATFNAGAAFGSDVTVAGTINISGDNDDLIISSADYENVFIGNRGASGTNLDKGYLRLKSEGTNTVVIDTAGDSYFNGGDVGIGITSPEFRQHVYHPTTNVVSRFESGDQQVWIDLHDSNSGTYGALLGHEHASDILFMVADANVSKKLVIQNNGDVGIGTSNPRYNLTVEGNNATAIGIGVDNLSGGSTLDIAALGSGYGSHQAGAGEVWFYSPDHINIGGATGNTNDVKFLANNSVNMIIKGANGNVGIGVTGPQGKLQVHGASNSAGSTNIVLVKNTTTASYTESAFVGTGRGLDFITNSAAEGDFTAIRWANSAGSRETALACVQNDNTTLDGTGQGDVVIQGYDGDRYSETQRFSANGSHIQKGQSRTGSYTSFALISHVYTFDHNNYSTAGTPSNTNEHWLEVPLYSSYSSSQGGGWLEMDICWHATHAQAGHLHSYKIVWGSAHQRRLNIAVVSSTATATAGSYNPYVFTSSSRLYKHPTNSDATMTKMYIQIKGSTNHSGGRSICLRGVAHPLYRNLAPVIDHGGNSSPDNITPAAETTALTVTG